MSNTNSLISLTDVRQFQDVKTVLAETVNNLGSMCQSGKVNKWSKWKPIIYATVSGITEQILKSQNYGFTIPTFQDIASAISSTDVWVYNKPVEYNRIGDFRNYLHAAIMPYNIIMPDYMTVGDSAIQVRLIDTTASMTYKAYNLKLSDMLPNYYFGVIIQRDSQVQIKTVSTVVSADSNTINISDCSLLQSAGTVTLMAVITTKAVTSWSTVAEQTIYSLNAEAGFALANVPIYAASVPHYIIGISGMPLLEAKKIAFAGSISYSNGRVTQNATLTARLTGDYTLSSIIEKVIRNSDGYVYQTSTISIDNSTSPQYLFSTDEIGINCNFNCAYALSNPPTLTGGDYYRYTFTFNYTASN